MTETTTPAAGFSTLDHMRWICDLHCLWRYCEKRSCQRARTCSVDPRHCLHFLSLVPGQARAFIIGWDEAKDAGLTYEQMMDEYAEEWQMLMDWNRMVRDTLPENRPKPAAGQ